MYASGRVDVYYFGKKLVMTETAQTVTVTPVPASGPSIRSRAAPDLINGNFPHK